MRHTLILVRCCVLKVTLGSLIFLSLILPVTERENESTIIFAQTEMTWLCAWLQRDCDRDLTACEGYESTRQAGANDVILLSANLNRMMDL